MILGIQLLGLIFGLFMLYYSFIHYKRKEFTSKEWTFWLLLWIVFLYVTLFPRALDFVVSTLNLPRTMDLFIIVGFMVLIAMFFYTYTLVRINQRKLEQIVRRIAKKWLFGSFHNSIINFVAISHYVFWLCWSVSMFWCSVGSCTCKKRVVI